MGWPVYYSRRDDYGRLLGECTSVLGYVYGIVVCVLLGIVIQASRPIPRVSINTTIVDLGPLNHNSGWAVGAFHNGSISGPSGEVQHEPVHGASENRGP